MLRKDVYFFSERNRWNRQEVNTLSTSQEPAGTIPAGSEVSAHFLPQLPGLRQVLNLRVSFLYQIQVNIHPKSHDFCLLKIV
jgi:hypothetical protein